MSQPQINSIETSTSTVNLRGEHREDTEIHHKSSGQSGHHTCLGVLDWCRCCGLQTQIELLRCQGEFNRWLGLCIPDSGLFCFVFLVHITHNKACAQKARGSTQGRWAKPLKTKCSKMICIKFRAENWPNDSLLSSTPASHLHRQTYQL